MIKLILLGPSLCFKSESHKGWKLKSPLILLFTMVSLWHLEIQTKKNCILQGAGKHAKPGMFSQHLDVQ